MRSIYHPSIHTNQPLQVWNNGTTPRAVLIADVWHPLLEADDRDEIRTGLQWSKRSTPDTLYH